MVDHVHALPEGYRLQEYAVTGTLGFGGFGITYSAHDTNLDMQVAIKEYLPSELAVRLEGSTVSAKSEQDKESFDWGLERFIDEGRAVARFNHPNIIRIHRFFEQNGTGYIVMELIEGGTLAEWLEKSGPLDEQQIRAWLWPVMDGLKVVHVAGYIHRDIKPQNIMMNRDGVPILLDFGAARMAIGGRTRSMTSIMTPGFAPLEQYQTRGQGPWTDVYALGAVLYKCISGKKPQDALDRVTNDQLEDPASESQNVYSPGVLKGVQSALAVAAKDRPQSIDAWLAILEGEEDNATRIMADSAAPRVSQVSSPSVSVEQPIEAEDAPPQHPETPPKSGGLVKWFILFGVLLTVAAGTYFWQGLPKGDKLIPPGNDPLQSEAKAKSPPKLEGVTGEPADLPQAESIVTNQILLKEEVSDSIVSGPTTGQPERIVENRGTILPGESFQDCEFCPVMVAIPAGQFIMGSPASEPGRAADEPAPHVVEIRQPFAMGQFEVTEAEFGLFAQEAGPAEANDMTGLKDRRPETGVSWKEAVAYTEWLSDRTGQHYRLPSEAEWEYAARAGTETARWWGSEIGTGQAHCRGCGSPLDQQQPASVGSFEANPFGLYDVHGNVSEWVWDCSNASSGSSSSNCPRRLFKGGSFVDQAASSRSAYRYVLNPAQSRDYLGFRVVRELPQSVLKE